MNRSFWQISIAASFVLAVAGASCAKASEVPIEDFPDAGSAFDASKCPDADLGGDPNNCGGCGHKCASGQVCSAGACKNECDTPTVKCPKAQACVDLTKDTAHCGTCTTACTPADAGGLDPGNGNPLPDSGVVTLEAGTPWDLGEPSCSASKCGVQCTGGKLACSGICFDPQQSHDHCGDCNTACPVDQACTTGHCCPPGQGWCNSACVDTQSDNNNCGTCGKVCSGGTPNCSNGQCIAGLSIVVEGHANVTVNCKAGDYSCQAHEVCNKVTGLQCTFQQYDCYSGTQGSWFPPDGLSGNSAFNFAFTYDLMGGNYGNICACTQSQMTKYGLAPNHTYCGLGHWVRQ